MTLAEKNIDKLANFYDNVEIFFRMNTACPLDPISHGRKFWNVFKNCRKPQFRFLEKGVLELHRAATIKPRKIERSGFFLLDHNGG